MESASPVPLDLAGFDGIPTLYARAIATAGTRRDQLVNDAIQNLQRLTKTYKFCKYKICKWGRAGDVTV